MSKYLALVAACCVLAGTQLALADGGSNASSPQATVSTPCTRIKNVYAERRWREAKPARGESVCPARRKAGAQNTIHHFYLWRRYRRVAPYRAYSDRGKWLTWGAVPRYILDCEGGTWDSHNPSGADGPAQMMSAPDVNSGSSPETKVRYWEAVSSLWSGGSGASNWVCA